VHNLRHLLSSMFSGLWDMGSRAMITVRGPSGRINESRDRCPSIPVTSKPRDRQAFFFIPISLLALVQPNKTNATHLWRLIMQRMSHVFDFIHLVNLLPRSPDQFEVLRDSCCISPKRTVPNIFLAISGEMDSAIEYAFVVKLLVIVRHSLRTSLHFYNARVATQVACLSRQLNVSREAVKTLQPAE
jgi:hypothetical protein